MPDDLGEYLADGGGAALGAMVIGPQEGGGQLLVGALVIGWILKGDGKGRERLGLVLANQPGHIGGIQPAAEITAHRHVGPQS